MENISKIMVFGIISTFQICSTICSTLDSDLKVTSEMKCIEPPKPSKVGIDLQWLGSVEKFYIPLWSKFHAHRTASDMFSRDARYISEFDLGPASCLIFRTGSFVSGFGKEIEYNMTGDGTSFQFKANWQCAKTGKFSFHLTDNQSFVLGVTCYEDNQAGWAVLSTKAFLEPKIRKEILEYVKALGFLEKNAVDENYAFCGYSADGEFYNFAHAYQQNCNPILYPFHYLGLGNARGRYKTDGS